MDDKLTPADPRDVETALALALTSGKALARSQSAETMSKIVAERLVATAGVRLRRHEAPYRRRPPAAERAGLMATYEARRFAVTGDQRSPAPYPRHGSDRHQPSRV
jgi:hypothetical protein